MSDKNDILDEQRRAREEFIKLKKMQSGEIEAGPKPSEIAIVPKTVEQKLSNIWFHFKWQIVGVVFFGIVMAILISQCANRPKYDMKAVIYAHNMVSNVNEEKIAEYLEYYGTDINGDGVVDIQVINCSFNKKNKNVQYETIMSQKLASIIATDGSALLFITDSEGYDYLNGISKKTSMFEGEAVALDEEFYEKTRVDNELSYVPEGLQISCRNIDGKAIAEDKSIKVYFEESMKIIEKIKQ